MHTLLRQETGEQWPGGSWAQLHRLPEPRWESRGVLWTRMDLSCWTLFFSKYPCSWPPSMDLLLYEKNCFCLQVQWRMLGRKLILFLIRSCSHRLVHISPCQQTMVCILQKQEFLPEELLSSKDIFYIMPIVLCMCNTFPESHTLIFHSKESREN